MIEMKEWKTLLSFTSYLQLSLLRTLQTMMLSRDSSNASLSFEPPTLLIYLPMT